MHASIPHDNINLCSSPVTDEALSTCVEERLCVLGLDTCTVNLLVVENDVAVAGWEFITLFFNTTRLRVVVVTSSVVVSTYFQSSSFVNLNGQNTAGIIVKRWCRDDHRIFYLLVLL